MREFGLNGDVLEKYFRAGDIVNKTLNKALNIVDEGVKVLKICEKLEDEIIRLGAKPAFPVNVSINSVAAHYTSPPEDITVIPKNSVVKVDVGAHINGYIVDAAITICLSPVYGDLVEASREALREASKALRSGLNIGRLGSIIEKKIKEYGMKPIKNLTGHLIDRYNLHAGKVIPNVSVRIKDSLKPGEVYAIEPFTTNGEGYVVEASYAFIFRLARFKRVKGPSEVVNFMKLIKTKFDRLPFAERWLKFTYSPFIIERCIKELLKQRVLEAYPVLVERRGGIVAQFEDTFIVTKEGSVPLARTLEIL